MRILLHVFFFFVFLLSGGSMVYSTCLRDDETILHIETFVTFDLDPSVTSRLIIDSALDQLKVTGE